MRALDASTGKIVWSYAAGSSVIAGATIADGTVFWGAGYSHFGPSSQVLANQNVKQNLANHQTGAETIVPPTLTYDREFAITLGGIEARVLHFGNAHTNGDSVVYFPNLKVVAVGDLVGAQPNPDFSQGGSLVGWGPVLAQILKLDFDVVVPSVGPQLTRDDLEVFKAKLETVISRATQLVRNGVSQDQLMVQLKTDDLGWHFSFAKEQIKAFYEELSRSRRADCALGVRMTVRRGQVPALAKQAERNAPIRAFGRRWA